MHERVAHPVGQPDDTPIHEELQQIAMHIGYCRGGWGAKVQKEDSLLRGLLCPEERGGGTAHLVGAK